MALLRIGDCETQPGRPRERKACGRGGGTDLEHRISPRVRGVSGCTRVRGAQPSRHWTARLSALIHASPRTRRDGTGRQPQVVSRPRVIAIASSSTDIRMQFPRLYTPIVVLVAMKSLLQSSAPRLARQAELRANFPAVVTLGSGSDSSTK